MYKEKCLAYYLHIFSEEANLHFMSYFLSFFALLMNINVEHRKL